MVILGHIQNGVIVPHGEFAFPDGTEVLISVCEHKPSAQDVMSPEQRRKYLDALAEIDSVANENRGDTFCGADHDSALYQ